jgi:hypothetical protein
MASCTRYAHPVANEQKLRSDAWGKATGFDAPHECHSHVFRESETQSALTLVPHNEYATGTASSTLGARTRTQISFLHTAWCERAQSASSVSALFHFCIVEPGVLGVHGMTLAHRLRKMPSAFGNATCAKWTAIGRLQLLL